MNLTLNDGRTVFLIGDPHLGKAFETGVPLDRRGEREKKQLEHFQRLLNTEADYIVIVGDLFDHPYVGFSVVLDTYKALSNAAAKHRNRHFIVMAGNHDLPRNLTAKGAFHLLAEMCHLRTDNLSVVLKAVQIGPIALFPWDWGQRADKQEIIGTVAEEPVELVVGHWDLHQFGENDAHMAPTKVLRERYGSAALWSGHFHVPGGYVVDGETVNCTGSMEPYSHGEDPHGEFYVTVTPAELEAMDPSEIRNKCVRVLLQEGEEMPSGIDCLALTPKRVMSETESITPAARGDFSWSDIVERKLADLSPVVREFITERLNA